MSRAWQMAASAVGGGLLVYAFDRLPPLSTTNRSGGTSSSISSSAVSSCRQRFETFASLREGPSTKWAMSFEDFVLSLCRGEAPSDRASAAAATKSATTEELARLFSLFDANGDSRLSYEEFCVLYTVLSTPARSFETAFRMFDHAEKGSISAVEFLQVLTAMSADPTAALDTGRNNGLMDHFFGPDRARRLTFEEFRIAARRLRTELLRTEFNLGGGGRTSMSVSELRRLIFHKQTKAELRSQELGEESNSISPPARTSTSTSGKRFASRRGASGGDETTSPVQAVTCRSQDDYMLVLDILHEAPTWLRGLQLYENAYGGVDGCACDKAAFARAVSSTGLTFPPHVVDLAFHVFDADGSGSLDGAELETVAKARNSFFAKYAPDFGTPDRNPIQQFAHCLQQKRG